MVALAESSGMFAGGDGQFLGRGLGLIGSTFGAVANVLIVLFFAVFMAAQPRPYVEGVLFLVPRKQRERVREVLDEIGTCCAAGWSASRCSRRASRCSPAPACCCSARRFAFALALLAGPDGVRALHRPVRRRGPGDPGRLRRRARSSRCRSRCCSSASRSLESYVLAPLVQHRAVHLPPAVILFAQVLMGVIVGALGVAVATPLAAAVMVAVSMLYVEDALGDKNAKPGA